MGSRMIRDRSRDSRWWLIIALFSICVVGWSLAFSFRAAATDSSTGAAPVVSGADRVWNLTDFNRIKIAASSRVRLVQGEVERISATGSDKALERLEVFVEDGELTVRRKGGHRLVGWRGKQIELVIEFIDIERLKLSGSTLLQIPKMRTSEFNLVMSGRSDIDIEQLVADSLNLRVSGTAEIDVAGAVGSQSIAVSGSADYDALELATETTSIRISGSADAVVAVSSALDAKISGSGSVRYQGQPEVSSSISGAGNIRPL